MAGEVRIELTDTSIQSRVCILSHRSPTATNYKNGGDDRHRTCDLLLAKQLLSQLSYTPKSRIYHFSTNVIDLKDHPGAPRHHLSRTDQYFLFDIPVVRFRKEKLVEIGPC